MKSLTLVFSAAFCLTAFSAFAGAPVVPSTSFTLAQADVTIGPNGVGIGINEGRRDRDRVRDHDRYRDHDRLRARLGDRDSDRGCRTVTVREGGETRTTRRCD